MNIHTPNMKRYYSIAIILAYVAGMDLFVYLKLLGLKELNQIDEQAQGAILPLCTSMGFFIALGIILLELKFFSKWQNIPFVRFILYKYAVITILTVISCLAIFMFYAILIERKSILASIAITPHFLETELFLSIFIFLIIFSVFLNILKTVYEYLGPQAISGAIFGKYSTPVEEDLTFLFMDLKSSTSFAEEMGHMKYSRFIEKTFGLLTESIQYHNATIYQFVGDEVVLLWPTKTAKKNLAPISLFYDFQATLSKHENEFQIDYGRIPRFKASANCGLVSSTEIRTIKKDIVYHGDVLNTCSRIMEQCSLTGFDLVVTEKIAEWASKNGNFKTSFLNEISLRGKTEATKIFCVTE